MYNWKKLENNYSEVWDKFYTKFNFQPSYHERKVPTISEPRPFVTFDLSQELSEKTLDEISLLFCSSFRQIIQPGTFLYWLDWQHDSYEIHPHIAEEAGFSNWYPDGDYYIFLA